MKTDCYRNGRTQGANLTPDKYAWRDQAACTNHTDLFEAAGLELERKGSHRDRPATNQAVAMCQNCPVINACLNEALQLERGNYGRWSIWGGLTPNQRARHTRKAATA